MIDYSNANIKMHVAVAENSSGNDPGEVIRLQF